MVVDTQPIQANGMTFTADVCGDPSRPLVLFLHGFPNSRHSWTECLEAAAEGGFFAVAPDQRGYSPGARPEGIDAYDVNAIVDDAVAVADALGAGRFHLVGHDWGGQVAWLTGVGHAARLRSLCVLSRPHPAAFARALADDPAQSNRSRHHRKFQDAGMAARLLADDAAAVRRTLCYENAASLFGEEGAEAPKRRMSDELADRHLSVIGNELAMDAALNWYRAAFGGGSTLARPDTPDVCVPTLYVWGDEDMSVGELAATRTGEHVSAEYRFERIAGAGHFLAEEVPEKVIPRLMEHLAANR